MPTKCFLDVVRKHFFLAARIFTSMSHGSIGIVQKIAFEIRPDFWCTLQQPSKRRGKCGTIRLCVCPRSCCSFWRALTGLNVNRLRWNFRGMFLYKGHLVVSMLVAIPEPMYKIILLTGFGYMAYENLGKYYPIAMKFPGYPYVKTRTLLILGPIGQPVYNIIYWTSFYIWAERKFN